MKHHIVVLIGNGPEDLSFGIGGIGQHSQRLVAVHGEYHMVKVELLRVGHFQRHPFGVSGNSAYRRMGMYPFLETLNQRGDVVARASGNNAPLGPHLDIHEAMILEKVQKIACGEIRHGITTRRPDGRDHGNKVAVEEGPGVATMGKEFGEGGILLTGL